MRLAAALLVFATSVAAQPSSSSLFADLRNMYRLYEECSGGIECLKVKLASGLDRAGRSLQVELPGGVRLVRSSTPGPEGPPTSEEEIQAALPPSSEARQAALDELILDRALRFLETHSVQFKLTDLDVGRSFQEEGRRRRKGLGPLLLLWLMMAGTMIPIKLGTLAMLAGKALIISKLALTLAAIVGLKKLLSSGDDHDHSYQVVQVPSHGHRRAIDQDLPYRAYKPL